MIDGAGGCNTRDPVLPYSCGIGTLTHAGYNDDSHDVKVLHGVSLDILDIVYLRFNSIYDRLYQLRKNAGKLDRYNCDAKKVFSLRFIVFFASCDCCYWKLPFGVCAMLFQRQF